MHWRHWKECRSHVRMSNFVNKISSDLCTWIFSGICLCAVLITKKVGSSLCNWNFSRQTSLLVQMDWKTYEKKNKPPKQTASWWLLSFRFSLSTYSFFLFSPPKHLRSFYPSALLWDSSWPPVVQSRLRLFTSFRQKKDNDNCRRGWGEGVGRGDGEEEAQIVPSAHVISLWHR